MGAAWYIVLSVSCLTLVAIAEHSQPRLFERFVGATSAMLVAVAVCAVGAACLSILTRRHGFYVARPPVGRGLSRATGLAMLFGLIVIPADLVLRHPADMNVPYPASVLFYPVIAFMVEILFHLLPLCLLLSVLTSALRRGTSTAIWASLVVVATLEPAFQVWTALSGTPVVGAHQPVSWRVALFDGAHVLAINGAQFALFKRYDFLSMLWLRLIYYGIWHIAWGHLRLTCQQVTLHVKRSGRGTLTIQDAIDGLVPGESVFLSLSFLYIDTIALAGRSRVARVLLERRLTSPD